MGGKVGRGETWRCLVGGMSRCRQTCQQLVEQRRPFLNGACRAAESTRYAALEVARTERTRLYSVKYGPLALKNKQAL